MIVVVNGAEREAPEGATVAQFVASLGYDPARPGLAVAVDGAVVPRSAWTAAVLEPGERVEIIGAAQGG